MTPQEIIDVVTAFRDGKRMEAKHKILGDSWNILAIPAWNFDEFDYRVAREPRRVWIHDDDIPKKQRQSVDVYPYPHDDGRIEFVEVMK